MKFQIYAVSYPAYYGGSERKTYVGEYEVSEQEVVVQEGEPWANASLRAQQMAIPDAQAVHPTYNFLRAIPVK